MKQNILYAVNGVCCARVLFDREEPVLQMLPPSGLRGEFTQEEAVARLGYPLMPLGKLSCRMGQAADGENRLREQLDEDTALLLDKTGEHGVLDLIVHRGKIAGAVFTTGSGSEYLAEEAVLRRTAFGEFPRPRFEIEYREERILTRDGIPLRTRIALPKAGEGKAFPTVLIRTCYGADGIFPRESLAACRGWAVVVQEVRGTGGSGGEFMPNFHEEQDGADTLRYLRRQSWCGKICVKGASYLGYTANAAAICGDVCGAVSFVAAGSAFYGDCDRKNGAISATGMLWDMMMSLPGAAMPEDAEAVNAALSSRPICAIPQKLTGQSSYIWDEFMKHPDCDAFWQRCGLHGEREKFTVPTLFVTGYHDGCINGSVEFWKYLRENRPENAYLVCGPWYHDFNGNRSLIGEYLSRDAVTYNIDLKAERFLLACAEGRERELGLPPVSMYIEGLGSWLHGNTPDCGGKTQALFLGSGGTLASQPTLGGSRDYCYDPDDPPRELFTGGEYMVPSDYSQQEARQGVLCFTTRPLTEDAMVVGLPGVRLFFSADVPDTDLVLRLNRVRPDGRSLGIASTIFRAKYYDDFAKPTPLEAGRIYDYETELPFVGRLLEAGDRLRLTVCSAAAGDYFPNTNTGGDAGFDTGKRIAHCRVHFGPEHPSCLKITILTRTEEQV